MTHMQELGVFQQPSYLGIGDEYVKRQDAVGRHRGKQFLTNPTKRGKDNSVTFEAFKPLFQKETYTDPGAHEKDYLKEQKKKRVAAQPFRPSSPSKKSVGLGNYYGTIGKQYEHMVDYDTVKKGDKPKDVSHPKRNVMTSPSKRGTYGVPKTTIGSEYEYKSDPYDSMREAALKAKQEWNKKRIGTAFKSTSHPLDFFDSQKSVAASLIYTADSKTLPMKPEARKEEKKKIDKVFKPSSPSKRGMNSTFTPFPEYKTDPYDKEPDNKSPTNEKRNERVFRPTSWAKSTPCRSIIFNNFTQMSL